MLGYSGENVRLRVAITNNCGEGIAKRRQTLLIIRLLMLVIRAD